MLINLLNLRYIFRSRKESRITYSNKVLFFFLVFILFCFVLFILSLSLSVVLREILSRCHSVAPFFFCTGVYSVNGGIGCRHSISVNEQAPIGILSVPSTPSCPLLPFPKATLTLHSFPLQQPPPPPPVHMPHVAIPSDPYCGKN